MDDDADQGNAVSLVSQHRLPSPPLNLALTGGGPTHGRFGNRRIHGSGKFSLRPVWPVNHDLSISMEASTLTYKPRLRTRHPRPLSSAPKLMDAVSCGCTLSLLSQPGMGGAGASSPFSRVGDAASVRFTPLP